MNQNLIEGILSKNHQSIARSITLIENNGDADLELIISGIYNKTGKSYRVGITGPPGAGKSSITNQLIKKYRSENKRVCALLVDPTSPFSSGAVLGDRIRIDDFYNDNDVFIRSLASRGSKGGLSNNIDYIGDIIEYVGFDIINYLIPEIVEN